MGKSIFEFGDKFGYNSPWEEDWVKALDKRHISRDNSSFKSGADNGCQLNTNKEKFFDEVMNCEKEAPANGYYYTSDGLFLGKEGNSTKVKICSKVEESGDSCLKTYWVIYKTTIDYSDLMLVGGTALAESSFGYGVENRNEIFGIANAINNYFIYIRQGQGTIAQSIKHMQAFAAFDGNAQFLNFKKTSDYNKNLSFMKDAVGAALNALHEKTCIDYSNGATHWDGIDMKKKGRKWSEGLKFQEAEADIFNIGENKKPVKQKYGDGKYYERIYDYKWTATKGYYGLNQKKKNPHFPYYKDDTQNKNRFGTVLMKLSDEYNKRIPYGDKKV